MPQTAIKSQNGGGGNPHKSHTSNASKNSSGSSTHRDSSTSRVSRDSCNSHDSQNSSDSSTQRDSSDSSTSHTSHDSSDSHDSHTSHAFRISSISIIIPCFNEKSTILTLLRACINAPVRYHKEIIVIDDCSTDGTREILQELESSDFMALNPQNATMKILYHKANSGKGAALRSGISRASGDIVLIQDADLEYDPNEYPKLLAPFEKGVADVVFGSRFISGDSHRVLYFWHRMGNGLLTLLSNMATNLNLTDMETCYKAFKREIIQQITICENRFGFEPEITAKIARIRGIRVYEVGISYYGRTYEEGKKIGIKDGFRALWAIIKYHFKD